MTNMYLPISRKYRPQNFDEIIGQNHISQTLKNAIARNKTAHAYLFTGQRGIGKTSTARILSKGLNCQKGPTPKPCNKCISCAEITKGISLDVMEIDGASNRGIDEIRNLRESIKLKPNSSRYRIYIIDEVHMLTPEAFNALLKTLEEPPSHVKFIFATTSAGKVPATIISRCQRFDFRSISDNEIVNALKDIAKHEKIKIDEDACYLIAKKSQGSLRDAEMMLDQIASSKDAKIQAEDISKMFGMIEQEALFQIAEEIANNNPKKVLDVLNSLLNAGKEPQVVASSLIEHFRNLLVLTVSGGEHAAHIGMAGETIEKLKTLSAYFNEQELFYTIYTLSQALDMIYKTSFSRIPLEISLLKLASKNKLMPIDKLMQKVNDISDNPVSQSPKSADAFSADESSADVVGTDVPGEDPSPEQNESSPSSEQSGVSPKEDHGEFFLKINNIWPEIIREVKNKKMSIGAYLEESVLLKADKKKIILGFSKNNTLHKEVLEAKMNTDLIRECIKAVSEIDADVECAFHNEKSNNDSSDPDNKSGSQGPQGKKKMEPIVSSAIDIFDGKIVRQSYL